MLLATAELVQILQTIPSLLWVGLALLLVVLFRSQIASLLPSLSSLKLPGGIEAQFTAAVTGAASAKNITVSESDQARLTRRAATNVRGLRGTNVLWIDDAPSSITAEKRSLESLGVKVDVADSDQSAVSLLDRHSYDLFISDMRRGTDADAGVRFLTRLRAEHHSEPMIFYVGRVDRAQGTPPYAFGITDRPDELLDYVMDIVARRRL
jgi:CheY-like chemotaxis protein